MAVKDDKNLQQVLDKIADMSEPRRSVMQRLHATVLAAAPDLKPRIWYGMPGYAQSAGAPVIVFIRNDELISLGVTEKATLTPAGGSDGLLMPCAWFLDGIDDVTESRVAAIVRAAVA